MTDELGSLIKEPPLSRETTPQKGSSTVSTYPMVGAFVEAEKIEGIGQDRQWIPANPEQKRFIEEFFTNSRGEISSIPEIESVASKDIADVNKFLSEKGFDIQLDELEPPSFGAASVLNLLVEWPERGQKVSLKGADGKDYEGVRIPKKVEGYQPGVQIRESSNNNHPVAELDTKSGDKVFITVVDEPSTGFDLIKQAEAIEEGLGKQTGHGKLVFPMVDLNQKVDVSWFEGMSTTGEDGLPAVVAQALQQNILKMNEVGARAASAFAFGGLRGGPPPPPDLVIDRPFLVWFRREGLSKPLFAGFVTQENWKNPGDITK